jgi:hypothetical protein
MPAINLSRQVEQCLAQSRAALMAETFALRVVAIGQPPKLEPF